MSKTSQTSKQAQPDMTRVSATTAGSGGPQTEPSAKNAASAVSIEDGASTDTSSDDGPPKKTTITKEEKDMLRRRKIRAHCMARPRIVTPKFAPPPAQPLKIGRLVLVTPAMAGRNWRINQLAVPRRRREKYFQTPAAGGDDTSTKSQKELAISAAAAPQPAVAPVGGAAAAAAAAAAEQALMEEENPCWVKTQILMPGEVPVVHRKTKACLKEMVENIEGNIPERVEHMARNHIR